MHKAKSQGRYLFIFVTHSVRYSDHQPEIIYCCARTEREAFQYIHRKVGKYISVRMIACVRRRSGWHFIQHFTDMCGAMAEYGAKYLKRKTMYGVRSNVSIKEDANEWMPAATGGVKQDD